MADPLSIHAQTLMQIKERMSAGNLNLDSFAQYVIQRIDSVGSAIEIVRNQFRVNERRHDEATSNIGLQATMLQTHQADIQRIGRQGAGANTNNRNILDSKAVQSIKT